MLKYKEGSINADVWGNHIGLNVVILLNFYSQLFITMNLHNTVY